MEKNKPIYQQKSLKQITHPVVVFLCTPRCGTQWIAKNLSEIYSDKAIVLHEPIENDYNPKMNLGRYDLPAQPKDNPVLNRHLDFIDDVTQEMNYIEVGWPGIAGISEFYQRFGERLKLIHLYRNPVKVAASLVTHNWYTGKIKDRSRKAELNPFDDTALLKEYRDKWQDLNLFEKSLYYWTEINLRAIEAKNRYAEIPFYSLRFEDLFEETDEIKRIALIETLSFMGLDYDNRMLKATNSHHDHYHSKTFYKIDWNDIFDHPQTIALAKKLGYRFDREIDLSRYRKKSLFNRFRHGMRSTVNRCFGLS